MVLIAGGMLALAIAGGGNGMPLGRAVGMAVVYGLMGLLYIIPSFHLFRYAKRIGTYLELGDVESLNFAPRSPEIVLEVYGNHDGRDSLFLRDCIDYWPARNGHWNGKLTACTISEP